MPITKYVTLGGIKPYQLRKEGTMSRASVKPLSLVALIMLAVAMLPRVVSATTTQNNESDSTISFFVGSDLIGPVDPQNPLLPVIPVGLVGSSHGGATLPNTGLTIVYASSFNFGSNDVSNKTEIYHAAPQMLSDGTARTNYIQISDTRGTFTGWNLKVVMTEFKTSNDDLVANGHGTLAGATVTLDDAEIQGDATANPADKSVVTTVLNPSVQSATLIGATAGKGTGSNLLVFGGKDGVTKNTAVTLSVPAGVAGAAAYIADFTWILDDTPEN